MSICSAGRSSSSRNYLLLSHSVSIFGCGGASEWSACDVRVLCEWCERSYCSPRRCNHCVSSDSIKLPGRRRRCVGARRNKQMVYTVQWLAKPNVFVSGFRSASGLRSSMKIWLQRRWLSHTFICPQNSKTTDMSCARMYSGAEPYSTRVTYATCCCSMLKRKLSNSFGHA